MSAVNIINAGGGAGVLAASLLPVSQRKISSLITGGGFKVVSGAAATPVSAVSADHQQTRSSTTSTCSQNHIGITTSFKDKSESTETSPRKQYYEGDSNSNSNSKSENISIIKTVNHHDIQFQRLSFKDYLEQSKNMMTMMMTSDGTGPPRWFSPLECASPAHHFPLLLFLPGLDGVGLGLILHHQRLGQMFDIWCLHIPIMDRTPFTELVNLVERTVKSENYRSPKRPIYLVGESLGGCLALAVAARNPDIDLVIIASNPATCFSKSQLQRILPLLKLMPPQFHLSVPYLLSLMTGAPSRMVTATVEKGLPLQQTVGELSQSFTALSSYLSVLASVLPGETLLWKLQMLKSASTYANSRLHAVKAQTLILSSGRDQLLPSQEEGERLRHILPNCQTRLFSESGHALFLEDGIDLVTVIKGASFYRRARYLNYVSDYMPPSPSEFKKIRDSVRWIEEVTCPVMLSTLENGQIVKGFSGIPSDGPVLLVGYHMLYGLELVPMVTRLWAERQILLRGLAHPMMYNNLKDDELLDLSNFDILRVMGAVPVSGKNFFRLLSSKSHVLLYPGGMREAVHRKGEEYKLFWPEQSEFVRMAARFGAKIIPFGVVGEDDFGQVVFDYNDQVKIPFLKAYYEEVTNRAVRLRTDTEGEAGKQALHLPVILPKFPGRFYYYFGKPIETAGRKQELSSRSRGQELYLEIKSEVERCLAYLKEKREKDPYRNILARLVYQATHGFDSEVPTFEL